MAHHIFHINQLLVTVDELNDRLAQLEAEREYLKIRIDAISTALANIPDLNARLEALGANDLIDDEADSNPQALELPLWEMQIIYS